MERILSLVSFLWGMVWVLSLLPIFSVLSRDDAPTIDFFSAPIKRSCRSFESPLANLRSLINLPNIREDLVYHGVNDRPDSLMDLAMISIGRESKYVKFGESYYLSVSETGWKFSDDQGPFSITLRREGNNLIAFFKGSFGEVFKEGDSWELQKRDCYTQSFSKFVDRVEKVRIFPSDKLFDIYGGVDYSDRKNLCRIFHDEVVFVGPGDCINFSDGWSIGIDNNANLLMVESLDPFIYTLWDKDGFNSFKSEKKITLEVLGEIKIDEVRCRGMESIVCRIDDKTYALRAGDWLIENGNSWRSVEDLETLNDYLNYKILRRSLVVDGIFDKDGKLFVQCHLFNRYRDSCRKIEIEVDRW